MTDEQRDFYKALGEHDAEWFREFREFMETIKSCTPEQVEQAIRMFEAMKKG